MGDVRSLELCTKHREYNPQCGADHDDGRKYGEEIFRKQSRSTNRGKRYYDALKAVNNLVKDARKVQQTVLLVGEISDIYVNSFQKMLTDENYTPDELSAIASGYAKMLEESSGMLNEMKTVVTSTSLSMTDKERMDVIDRVYRDVRNQRNLVRYYTNRNIGISYLRAKRRTIPEGCWTCTERTIKNTGDMTGEETFSNLHEVLRNLYDEMMPLCSDITGVATGVAALGALFYVASGCGRLFREPSRLTFTRSSDLFVWGRASCSSPHSFWELSTAS